MTGSGVARGNPTVKLTYLLQLRCEQAFQSTEDRWHMRHWSLAIPPPHNDTGS